MELLSAAIDPPPNIPELNDNAFMTGLFSLLDVLINLPMREILAELPLQGEIVDALISPDDGGVLGQVLSLSLIHICCRLQLSCARMAIWRSLLDTMFRPCALFERIWRGTAGKHVTHGRTH